MTNLFKKAAIFTDLHVGLKSNSQVHNQDCSDFIDWFIVQAKNENCDTILMLGDWHNNRASINVLSLNYSYQFLERLNQNFTNIFVIPGNHDLYYRDKRDAHSLVWARKFPNIQLVDKKITDGDVTFLPWLVGDEWKQASKIKSRYVFGHLELPFFYMNAMVQMPDHKELNHTHFKNQDLVFSGHFHKRQQKDNVVYIGNSFPHNYSDVHDDERGMTILEWGQTPRYITWPDAPKYRSWYLSDLLENHETWLKPSKIYAKVGIDGDITYEEANLVRETFVDQYDIRELSLIPAKKDEDILAQTGLDVQFASVDQIVHDNIENIDSEFFDKNLLLEIYRQL